MIDFFCRFECAGPVILSGVVEKVEVLLCSTSAKRLLFFLLLIITIYYVHDGSNLLICYEAS